jgi:hypothetical protein
LLVEKLSIFLILKRRRRWGVVGGGGCSKFKS